MMGLGPSGCTHDLVKRCNEEQCLVLKLISEDQSSREQVRKVGGNDALTFIDNAPFDPLVEASHPIFI